MARFALLLGLLLALAACESETAAPGVVARVNGRPIYLYQLEFKNDLLHIHQPKYFNPSIEELRAEYGAVLGDLVIQQLIMQDLAERGLEVTDEELAEAEARVREDYPEGTFEEVLVEEYIDIKSWREQLRARLALEKLNDFVLRPQIKLDYVEAEQYYRNNISDFYLPKRQVFLLIQGPSRELVEKADQLYGEKESIEEITTKLSQVEMRLLKMREDRLPVHWREALAGLEPGQHSQVRADKSGFERLILVETVPAKVLDPSQAYPLIERILLEKKLGEAFDEWLSVALASARIEVSTHLLPKEEVLPDHTNEEPLLDGS